MLSVSALAERRSSHSGQSQLHKDQSPVTSGSYATRSALAACVARDFMPTLRELLDQHLPFVLLPDPERASVGTEIIAALVQRNADFATYAEASLRQYFSGMAKDPTSCIARVEGGHGYYLRQASASTPIPSDASFSAAEEETGRREKQPEEKFRAIFLRWAELEDRAVFGMPIEHTRATKAPAGTNLWKFPDAILVRWLLDIENSNSRFDPHSRQLRASLGERLFRLNSIELKVNTTIADARWKFFQCVSNSRWAHTASLVVAEAINDERVAAELRRLGTSYGIEVKSFGIGPGVLDTLPGARAISDLSDASFAKEIAEPHIRMTILSPGEDRPELDWSYLADIRPQHPDFNELLAWLSFCISNGQPYRHAAFRATL